MSFRRGRRKDGSRFTHPIDAPTDDMLYSDRRMNIYKADSDREGFTILVDGVEAKLLDFEEVRNPKGEVVLLLKYKDNNVVLYYPVTEEGQLVINMLKESNPELNIKDVRDEIRYYNNMHNKIEFGSVDEEKMK